MPIHNVYGKPARLGCHVFLGMTKGDNDKRTTERAPAIHIRQSSLFDFIDAHELIQKVRTLGIMSKSSFIWTIPGVAGMNGSLYPYFPV